MEFANYLDAFYALKQKLLNKEFVDELVELTDVSFTIPHNIEYVDVPTKKTDKSYCDEELKWYLKAIPNIYTNERIAKTKIWQNVSSIDGMVNSNYGFRIFPKETGNQFDNCIECLVANEFSKQAVMIYTFPETHSYKNDGFHARSDMICTIYVQLLIRNNKLEYYVYMRSNDAFYGFQNDYPWHRYIHRLAWLKLHRLYSNLIIGDIHWHATSFHVYPRHFKFLEAL